MLRLLAGCGSRHRKNFIKKSRRFLLQKEGGVRAAPPPRLPKLLLFSDYQVLDLVVGGLGNNLLVHQVGLLGIRAAVNNLL
jgi:hypothetical protein